MSAPALTPAAAEPVTIRTRLFGPLTVDRRDFIHFPEGLLGFAGERDFVLLPTPAEGIAWLQETGDAGVVFLTVDPFRFFADFALDVVDGTDEEEQATRDGDLDVRCIVTLPADRSAPCTVNLQAPLLIDRRRHVARQFVAHDSPWHTRHELDLRAQLQG